MYSLVTGATGVLGRCFALELLSRGDDLYLTGRSSEKLNELKSYLKTIKPEAKIRVFACDLADYSSRAALFEDAKNLRFGRVINCAGADIQKPLREYDDKKLTFQVRVNFEAAASVCLFALSHAESNLQIINVSSVSGIYPMPNFALYSAAKGALTSFSQSLNEEIKGEGKSCTAIVAGAIYTRPDVIENIKTQGLWGKIAAKRPEFVVKKSLKAAQKGKGKCIVGAANKLMRTATALIPQKIRLRYINKRWSKTRKDAF